MACRLGPTRVLLSVGLSTVPCSVLNSSFPTLPCLTSTSSCWLPRCRLLALLPFDVSPNGPDESQQLAGHGGHHLLARLALARQVPVAMVQPVLRLPGD